MRTTLLIASALVASAFAGPYDAWAKYREVTVNTTSGEANVVNTVANFPLLVRLTAANAADVLADDATGASLRFASADGETAYKYVIERWTASAAEVWVRVPSIAGNASTTLRMYWGNGSAPTESSGPDVFQPSNGFLAVYMMNEAVGATLTDATGNGNSATPGTTNPTDNTTGVGVGKSFAGNMNSHYLVTGGDAAFADINTNVGPYTISAWANPTSCAFNTNRYSIFSKYSGTAGQPKRFALQGSSGAGNWRITNDAASRDGSTTLNEYNSDVSCTAGQWQMLTATYSNTVTATGAASDSTGIGNGTNLRTRLWRDRDHTKTGGANFFGGSNTPGPAVSTYIGRDNNGIRNMNGGIDHITVSNVVRDSNWIRLSFETQKEGPTAVTLGGTVTSLQGFKTPVGGMSVQLLDGKIVFNITDASGAARAGLSIVDVWGRTVWSRTVLPGAGTGQAFWDGRTAGGQAASSGLYVARITLLDGQNRVLRTAEKKVPFTR